MIQHLIFHFIIGSAEESDEPYLVWKCPRCGEVKEFHLLVYKRLRQFLCFTFPGPEHPYDLRCNGCDATFDVPPEDLPVLEQAREATSELQAGRLTADAYKKIIEGLSATSLDAIRGIDREGTWKCPHCQEENPANFSECWNCHKDGSAGKQGVDPEAPPLPGFRAGGNPWES